jgi:hypothetical protein
MAYNQFNNCGSSTDITGVLCTPNIAAPVKPFLTKKDFEYSTEEDANTLATVTTEVADLNVFPLPKIEEFSDNSEEDTKYTSPINSVQTTIKKGKTIHNYMFKFDPSLNSRLQSFDGTTMRYYYSDNNDNIIGTSPDGVVFKGFEVLVNVDKWKDSDGSTPAFISVTITIISNLEREKNVAVFEADYDVQSVNGVNPATLTEKGVSTATTVVVNVISSDNGVPISGLVVANFIFLQDSDGTEETISTAVESLTVPGEYTLSATAFETGTVNLRDTVTIGSELYKGTAIAITIA